MKARIFVPLLLACSLSYAHLSYAQQSASFKLEEHAFNAAGRPLDGTVATSASYRLTLDALGEAVDGRDASSASFALDGGLVPAYPPPGEVSGLRFTSHTGLLWLPERSVGEYDLYRGPLILSDLSSADPADCLESGIATEGTTDLISPLVGQGFFYLVTAENRLGEKGTKGFRSDGTERGTLVPCP